MSSRAYPDRPVFIIDDERSWLRSLSLLLERTAGINHIKTCQDSRQVMTLLRQEPASLVLLDITMPHVTGEELLQQIREEYPEIPVIINSGRNQVDIAVRCMQNGAFDYFVKTVEEERLVSGVQKALTLNALQEENRELRDHLLQGHLKHPEVFSDMVSESPASQAVCKYVEAIAASPEPVLITGESGVGKELIARAIHRLAAADEPWVAVNAAGLDDQVFADTLFGHIRGAFTDARAARDGMVEKAGRGILFLDEIGDLEMASQVKLLRLLQEKEYYPLGSDSPRKTQARFVMATNQNLEEKMADGSFRKDLYYRLSAHRVHLPPLRERREDLAVLIDHFLNEASTAMDKKKPTPPPELNGLLAHYSFPGNIRELRAMVYDAVSRHQRGVLSLSSFKEVTGETVAAPMAQVVSNDSSGGVSFPEELPSLKQMSEMLVDEALRRTSGNQTQAARLLGVTRPALSKRLKNRRES
jgi:DNA-binding NtrC family response regulator